MAEKNKHPYYIVTPPYRRTSAGVRVLYRLCSLLYLHGYPAYLLVYPYQPVELSSSPTDNTPVLTESIAQYHFDIGLTPIIIAPESVNVTKFDPIIFCRYYLHYKSFLDNVDDIIKEDFSISYTKEIESSLCVNLDGTSTTLFILVSDPKFFTPPENNSKRSGCAYYAGKYKDTFGQKTFDCIDSCIEITRDRVTSQNPEEIRDIFRSVEVFYSYEDTALTIEANLCGCPVVFLPNKYFESPLIKKEVCELGYSIGNTEAGLEYAKSTVDDARALLVEYYNSPWNFNSDSFIADSQKLARETEYSKMFAQKYFYRLSFISVLIVRIRQFNIYIKDFGVSWVASKLYKRIKSLRFKI